LPPLIPVPWDVAIMPLRVLTRSDREHLYNLFVELKRLSEKHVDAGMEAMTALRCLKAVHSNAIEDTRVDRVFLQILLHGAGIPDKSKISQRYHKASLELTGQDKMLKWLESEAANHQDLSISMLLEMQRRIFGVSWPDEAGRFRQIDVEISGMQHLPPHYRTVPELMYQQLSAINDRLVPVDSFTQESFFDVLRLSAQAHFYVAHSHPFRDGNGRIARAVGDYVFLYYGLFYDVIMTDYKEDYLDALEESSIVDSTPLYHFIEFSYLETLERISGFFKLVAFP
jgi:Fic family protein